jgi:site-specific DNA-methyltransferase (adenine-specific)
MLDMLEILREGEVSSIVTDPPYELNFMWKWWDNSWIAFQKDTWKKCLEVLKPWWYLLAFWGSRTYHRIACAIEDAGFEIRDCIMWLYGSWFPKSMNIWLAIDKKNWVESEVIWQQVVPDITGDAYGTMNDKQGGSYKNVVRDIKKATNERAWWGTALKPSYEPIIVARKPLEWSCTDNVIKYW